MRRSISALVLSAGLAVAAIQPAAAIVYGQPDGSGHPNVGAMLVQAEDELLQFCSGTLIAPGVFLTAAHCTDAATAFGFDVGDVRITFDSELPGDLIEVESWYQHPRFNTRTANWFDMAVLYFDADHPEAAGIVPAPVADLHYLEELGARVLRTDRYTAVGYGAVRSSKTKGPQGIVPGTERRVARQGFQTMTKAWITFAMNSRAVTNGGTCYGDSGGPHFHDGVLVSLTVRGDAVCKAVDKTYRLDTPWAQDFLADALAAG